MIRIVDWDKWQSYRKDRGQPPWIKVHRRLLRNPKWIELSSAQRGQLVVIWLLAADHDGVIEGSPEMVSKLGFMSEPLDLQVFIDAGFIECDDNLTSTRRQDDAKMTPQNRSEESRSEESRVGQMTSPRRQGDVKGFTLTHIQDCCYQVGIPDSKAESYYAHYGAQGWKTGSGQPITDPRLHMQQSHVWNRRERCWTWELSGKDRNGGKPRLFPIPGKSCSVQGCIQPAVYKDAGAAYDHWYCGDHMPAAVKEKYRVG